MPQIEEELLCIDEALLAETQDRVNGIFTADLICPVYIIRETEDEDERLMSVSGGPASLVYRNVITGWRGCGYLIWVRKKRMEGPLFRASILHEIAHCFQKQMEVPWSCWPEDTGLAVNCRDNVHFTRCTNYESYRWHREDFWRLAVHVWYRAALAGYESSLADFGKTWVSPSDMQKDLEREIRELEGVPLWKIGRRPVPKHFAKLFDFDPRDWDDIDSLSHLPSPSDKGACNVAQQRPV